MKILPFLVIMLLNSALSGQPEKTVFKTIGGKTVYSIDSKNVYLFTSGLMIDADGSPKAYHQDNSKALDYLANAGKPGNWWALVTDNQKSNGNPVVQTANDPAPGYYISTTSLQDKTKRSDDPNRYVNSESIPYIVLPSKFATDFKLGDIALVINKKNDKRCFAIFADTGPSDKIGEGSVCLAEQLGVSANPKKGGTNTDILYILFKNSGKKKVLTKDEIDEAGKSKLTDQDIIELLTN